MITKVDLPPGAVVDDALQGSPPRVQDGKSGMFQSIHWGLFVCALEVVGRIKIFNFANQQQLVAELQKYCNEQRVLYLTDAEPEVGSIVYEIVLPKGDLGLTLKGFPPVISAVSSSSPLFGMVRVGERVERVIIPECNIDLSLSSGGFTNHRVTKTLHEHEDFEGRILVVAQEDSNMRPVNSGGDDLWWDWGSFRDTSRWSLRRMLSNRPSQRIEEESQTNEYLPVKKVAM